MAIKIRQSNGLTATMDSPNAPQDLSNPLIGPNFIHNRIKRISVIPY